MLALVFDEILKLEDVPVPERKENDSLIQVKYAGICNTDIEIVKGYMGFHGILGHEFTGIIKESSNKKLIGKRVVGEINIGCGKCRYCLGEISRHCPDRSVLGIQNRNGVFAEYIVLPNKNLHIIPDSVEDKEAVFTEPIAAALEILEQVHIKPTENVAVIGDGKLGSLVAQVLKTNGNDISVFGKNKNKLSIIEAFNIRTYLSENEANEKFDIVIECSGNPAGFIKALDIIKPRGTIVLKSTYHGNLNIDFAPVVVNEINIVGSRCGRFEPALRFLEKKLIRTKDLITIIFKLDESISAFNTAQEKDSLKVLIQT